MVRVTNHLSYRAAPLTRERLVLEYHSLRHAPGENRLLRAAQGANKEGRQTVKLLLLHPYSPIIGETFCHVANLAGANP
jgi:hypothetical protein